MEGGSCVRVAEAAGRTRERDCDEGILLEAAEMVESVWQQGQADMAHNRVAKRELVKKWGKLLTTMVVVVAAVGGPAGS